jgi:hypothetical protein
MAVKTLQKDPDETIRYMLDWTDYFEDIPDTITGSLWSASTGISVSGSAFEGYETSVLVSGGVEGELYSVTNTITTEGGQTIQRSIDIVCVEK